MKTRAIYKKEMKMNLKQLLIWSMSVGGLGMICLLMYQSMQGEVQDMADMFSNMGSFSDAFGMSTLSIATLEGYFATEVGTVHGLGSAMFAAILAIGMIAKEEEKHSGEFLLALPVSRSRVLAAKGACILSLLLLFTLICGCFYLSGAAILQEELPLGEFLGFMAGQLLMNIEIAAICFLISGMSAKLNTGLGLGIALLFYFYDLIGRVVPDLKEYLFLGPFSFANASEIFSGKEPLTKGIILAFVMILCAAGGTFWIYNKRDLSS